MLDTIYVFRTVILSKEAHKHVLYFNANQKSHNWTLIIWEVLSILCQVLQSLYNCWTIPLTRAGKIFSSIKGMNIFQCKKSQVSIQWNSCVGSNEYRFFTVADKKDKRATNGNVNIHQWKIQEKGKQSSALRRKAAVSKPRVQWTSPSWDEKHSEWKRDDEKWLSQRQNYSEYFNCPPKMKTTPGKDTMRSDAADCFSFQMVTSPLCSVAVKS